MLENEEYVKQAAEVLLNSRYTTAFTGAGISVESGIPPFRGEDGIWSKYDPMYLELHNFIGNPQDSWPVIKEIFYTHFIHAKPNGAHFGLASLEKKGLLENIITQNIDNLHQEAGNSKVYEFHGNTKFFVCLGCEMKYKIDEVKITNSPPKCKECSNLLKPDFIFFGEGIPEDAYLASVDATQKAEALIIIGTSGQIAPANQIPYLAKQNGAKIIEINLEPSPYTKHICDFFLKGKASLMMENLLKFL